MLSVYTKRTEVELSTRRLEVLEKYNKIIQYGRMNPAWFIENIFKVELLDYQTWVIMSRKKKPSRLKRRNKKGGLKNDLT